MKIELDEETLAKAATDAMTRACLEAAQGYQLQRIVQEAASASLLEANVGAAVDAAIKAMDFQALARDLSQELARMVTAAAHEALCEATAGVIVAIRKGDRYLNQAETERLRGEVIARLQKRKDEA